MWVLGVSVSESFLPILPNAWKKWTPAGSLHERLSENCYLAHREGWQGEFHFLRITGSLQILSDTVYGWGKFRSPVQTVGTSEIFAKGREQTQSILFFFISWIAGQWRSKKFMYFLFWDPGQACGRLSIENWLWNTQELGGGIMSTLISSPQECRLLNATQKSACNILFVCLSVCPIFLLKQLPKLFSIC